MRMCGNCKNRAFHSWSGVDYCIWYEMACSEEEEIRAAKDCPTYECGDPFPEENGHYCPSASAGDYGPSCPWNAPGMSVHDFI